MWFSCHTCTSVLVEHGERFGVQHAMHGCESGHKAFVWLSSMPLCSHSSQSVLFVESHWVVWVHNAHLVYPPCCHTTCFHQPTMVAVSSSSVCWWAPCPRVVVILVVPPSSHHHWWCGLLLWEEAQTFESLRDGIIRMPIWTLWKHQRFAEHYLCLKSICAGR